MITVKIVCVLASLAGGQTMSNSREGVVTNIVSRLCSAKNMDLASAEARQTCQVSLTAIMETEINRDVLSWPSTPCWSRSPHPQITNWKQSNSSSVDSDQQCLAVGK
jgi:hypothetical protein